MKNPPKRCHQCEELRVLSVYIDGSCDYTCSCPICEYREAYKEAESHEGADDGEMA